MKAFRLGPALIVTCECDVVRDEGEAYAHRLIIAGRVKPSEVVSHRLPLSQAPEAFQK